MRSEAVAYQHPWLLISSFHSLGIGNKLKPLQTKIRVVIHSRSMHNATQASSKWSSWLDALTQAK